MWGVAGVRTGSSCLPLSEVNAAKHLLQQRILKRVDEAPASATTRIASSSLSSVRGFEQTLPCYPPGSHADCSVSECALRWREVRARSVDNADS